MPADPTYRAPWDRQPDENAAQYGAFVSYRDLGPFRTVAGAHIRCQTEAEKAGSDAPALDTLYKWKKVYNWESRATAWDEIRDAETRRRLALSQAEAASRHAQAGQTMQALGLKALESATPEKIHPGTAATIIAIGVDVERKALSGFGDAGRAEVTGADGLSDAELERLARQGGGDE